MCLTFVSGLGLVWSYDCHTVVDWTVEVGIGCMNWRLVHLARLVPCQMVDWVPLVVRPLAYGLDRRSWLWFVSARWTLLVPEEPHLAGKHDYRMQVVVAETFAAVCLAYQKTFSLEYGIQQQISKHVPLRRRVNWLLHMWNFRLFFPLRKSTWGFSHSEITFNNVRVVCGVHIFWWGHRPLTTNKKRQATTGEGEQLTLVNWHFGQTSLQIN